ncbi:MAG TPA: VWA domain-containing protein, partial [candidate division Zixibacteria bacterium]|nr:VWA domain-containing protein [candidate division Zixibacteria bacterium]
MRKTIIILMMALAFASFAKVAEPFEVQEEIGNSFIKVVCGNDGKFTIGTADGKRLLYGFPSAGSTSHTNIRVDADTLAYGNWTSFGSSGTITEALHINGGALEMTFTYADVDVTQRLSIVRGPTTGNDDTILIEYYMHNRASTARSVGVMLEMDTMISGNDAAPISTSFGYVAIEQDFTAPSIPQYWQAFEVSPTQAESLLVGQGTLIGSGAVMPNRFCLGPWGTYDDVRWNYTSTGNPYGDSAVLLWWNPVNIPAGGTHHVATLYGVGAGSISAGDLALNITAPLALDYDSTTGGYTPNPFTVNALVTNTTSGTVDGVTATISLPEGLSLASGETATKNVSPSSLGATETGSASWSVVAESRTDAATLEYTVSTSGGGYSNSMNRTIDIPAGTTEGVNITVTRVDAEEFPVIHAYCIVTDDARNPIIGLDERHFVVHEDGVFESPITVEMMATSVLGGQADIAVVFDVTGSMGSYITAMKDNVINFADNLAASGMDARWGLVTFLDEIGQVFDFTSDVDEFRGWVTGLRASGGGDTPENALDGIARALELGFRPSAQRIIIMITDAPYHQANSRTDYIT